jgi:hypothetical protein
MKHLTLFVAILGASLTLYAQTTTLTHTVLDQRKRQALTTNV